MGMKPCLMFLRTETCSTTFLLLPHCSPTSPHAVSRKSQPVPATRCPAVHRSIQWDLSPLLILTWLACILNKTAGIWKSTHRNTHKAPFQFYLTQGTLSNSISDNLLSCFCLHQCGLGFLQISLQNNGGDKNPSFSLTTLKKNPPKH